MRVNNTGTNGVQGSDVSSASESGKTAKTRHVRHGEKHGETSSAAAADPSAAKVELSGRGRDALAARAAAQGAPDVREDKIAELKKRIAAGGYKVDADAIADKMVSQHLETSEMG
jgi:negative regulator of flagellin synthesis FlgM